MKITPLRLAIIQSTAKRDAHKFVKDWNAKRLKTDEEATIGADIHGEMEQTIYLAEFSRIVASIPLGR